MNKIVFRSLVVALAIAGAALILFTIYGGRRLPRDTERAPSVPADGIAVPARR